MSKKALDKLHHEKLLLMHALRDLRRFVVEVGTLEPSVGFVADKRHPQTQACQRADALLAKLEAS